MLEVLVRALKEMGNMILETEEMIQLPYIVAENLAELWKA